MKNLRIIAALLLAFGSLFLVTPAHASPTVIVTPGGDDNSYQIPLTQPVTFFGAQYSSIYATTNAVITFGRPDGTFHDFPMTPSISLGSTDWVVYPAWRSDEHFIISYTENSFQVDMSARPIWLQNTPSPSRLILTGIINDDRTISFSYYLENTSNYSLRFGVRTWTGEIKSLDEGGFTQAPAAPEEPGQIAPAEPATESETVSPDVSESPTVSPEPEPEPVDNVSQSPTVSPSPEPSPTESAVTESPVSESPTTSPEPTTESSPTESPQPTPTPSPEPTPEPEPTPPPPTTQEITETATNAQSGYTEFFGSRGIDPANYSQNHVMVEWNWLQVQYARAVAENRRSLSMLFASAMTSKLNEIIAAYEAGQLLPNPAPQPLPTPSPEPSPEPTPTPTPSPQPEPTPVPSPEPTPTPQPEPEPTLTPTPEPTPTQTPSPEPTPEPQPTPSETTRPTPSPEPEPTPEPVDPTPTPSPEPEPSPTPTPEPTPPVQPTPAPSETTQPSPTPTPVPTPTPSVPEPTPIVTPTPIPNPEPKPTPTPIPAPTTPEEVTSNTPIADVIAVIENVVPNSLTEEQAEVLVSIALATFETAEPGSEEYQQALDLLLVAAQQDDIVLDEELAAIPLIGNVAGAAVEVLNALGNAGADMSPQVREQSEKVVIASVIVANIAITATAAASAAAAAARRP